VENLLQLSGSKNLTYIKGHNHRYVSLFNDRLVTFFLIEGFVGLLLSGRIRNELENSFFIDSLSVDFLRTAPYHLESDFIKHSC